MLYVCKVIQQLNRGRGENSEQLLLCRVEQ